MNSPLFRREALAQLSSPEQLHQMVRIASPMAWLALAVSMLCIAVAIGWGFLGRLPTTVVGEGVLIRIGGTFNVVSRGNGVVVRMGNFAQGARVRKGQEVARLAQPELDQQVTAQQATVDRLEQEQVEVSKALASLGSAQQAARQQQAQAQQRSIEASESRLRSLQSVEQAQTALLRDGLVTRQRVEETRQQILAVQNEISAAGQGLLRLSVDQVEGDDRSQARQRDIALRLAQARAALDELRLRRELAASIVSEHDGIVLEVMAAAGDLVGQARPVMSIELADQPLEAVMYLPSYSSAKLIKSGMRVQVSPVTAQRERFGFIEGRVVSVSQYPATEQGMLALIENPALVRQLAKGGAPIAVMVDLLDDPSTRSGHRWSSSAGAGVELSSGTLAMGSFVVEEKRPISLLIPLLREALGL